MHSWQFKTKYPNLNPTKRNNIEIGQFVAVVLKKHQATGELTEGIVKRILTNAAHHPHGIKVKLDSGEVGRVQTILEEDLDEDPLADLFD